MKAETIKNIIKGYEAQLLNTSDANKIKWLNAQISEANYFIGQFGTYN